MSSWTAWPRHCGTGGGIALALGVFVASPGFAQQEPPLTPQTGEDAEGDAEAAAEAAAAESQRATEVERAGAQYVDNPDWLTKDEPAAAATSAQESSDPSHERRGLLGRIPGYRRTPALGLSPHAPQQTTPLPEALTPAFGAPASDDEFRFDFHGYLQAGLRAGMGERLTPEGEAGLALHGDPIVVGGAFGWFEHTNTVPVPWAQMNFSFGNEVVRATAILAAWSLSQSDQAAGYFQPPAQLGFNDAFITYTPNVAPVGLEVNIGVFTERYGAMGRYDAGAYGTSLIGTVYGTGATSTVSLPFQNEVTATIEAGVKGDFNTPSVELVPDQSNEFARPIEGSTYAVHGHAAFDFDGWVEVTSHGIYSFSQDDRGDALEGRDLYLGDLPRRDGSIAIVGADARFQLRRFGHLYIGGSHVVGRDALTVANLVQVLNNGPGRDLARRFWGFDSGGNGTLTLFGGQYELSLGRLLRHPVEFATGAPDLTVALFGIFGVQANQGQAFEDSEMLKAGAELTYGPLSWLALAGRADLVMPELGDPGRSFGVLTPRVVFRTDWSTQAALTMQYSGYLLGNDVEVRGDERLLNNPSGKPDPHLFALYGTLWW